MSNINRFSELIKDQPKVVDAGTKIHFTIYQCLYIQLQQLKVIRKSFHEGASIDTLCAASRCCEHFHSDQFILGCKLKDSTNSKNVLSQDLPLGLNLLFRRESHLYNLLLGSHLLDLSQVQCQQLVLQVQIKFCCIYAQKAQGGRLQVWQSAFLFSLSLYPSITNILRSYLELFLLDLEFTVLKFCLSVIFLDFLLEFLEFSALFLLTLFSGFFFTLSGELGLRNNERLYLVTIPIIIIFLFASHFDGTEWIVEFYIDLSVSKSC